MNDTNTDEEPGPAEAVDWMAPVDDDILEVFRDDEEAFTPDHIEEAGICRGPDAAYRCRELADRGLLKKHAIGMYEITERGEQFLSGDLEPAELETDD